MEILPIFDRFRLALEDELREAACQPTDLLDSMLSVQMGWSGHEGQPKAFRNFPRLRGYLCLLTCESISDPSSSRQYSLALPSAAAVELVHNQAMAHQAIHEFNRSCSDASTVMSRWGPGQAINAGDGLHALGRLALIRLKSRGQPALKVIEALQIFDHACIRMCEGQHMDLVIHRQREMKVQTYLAMVELKCGALMGCASGLGALAAGADAATIDSCQQAGQELGVAHQIHNDMLNTWDNEGSPTSGGLPVVYALEKARGRQSQDLKELWAKGELSPAESDRLLGLLEELSVRSHIQNLVQGCVDRALERFSELELPSQALSDFTDLGEYLLTRKQ